MCEPNRFVNPLSLPLALIDCVLCRCSHTVLCRCSQRAVQAHAITQAFATQNGQIDLAKHCSPGRPDVFMCTWSLQMRRRLRASSERQAGVMLKRTSMSNRAWHKLSFLILCGASGCSSLKSYYPCNLTRLETRAAGLFPFEFLVTL